MFGMVTALVIQEAATAAASLTASATEAGPIRSAARAGGSSAFLCRIPRGTA